MSKEEKGRTIQTNVAKFEELVSVKRSIYPWDSLKNGAGNFFVECANADAARSLKGSVRSSGLNYYLKRQIKLVPVVIVAKVDGTVGVLCSAIAAE